MARSVEYRVAFNFLKDFSGDLFFHLFDLSWISIRAMDIGLVTELIHDVFSNQFHEYLSMYRP